MLRLNRQTGKSNEQKKDSCCFHGKVFLDYINILLIIEKSARRCRTSVQFEICNSALRIR